MIQNNFNRETGRGISLIETVLYASLLSLLLSSFVYYTYSIHLQDIRLIHDIEDAYTA